MSEENNKKDIEVVEGIGNLDISPVYDHLNSAKPKMQDEKPKNIVIPPVKKDAEKDTEQAEVNDNDNDYDDTEDLEDAESDTEKIEFEDVDLDDAE
ncbi:MAG: hypothetical protein IKF17_01450 [Clostridia bacterium]|nr:hypothetical protein [Clostridia bacterium]